MISYNTYNTELAPVSTGPKQSGLPLRQLFSRARFQHDM